MERMSVDNALEAIGALRELTRFLRGRFLRRFSKRDKVLLSSIYCELLKTDPDLTVAEAKLKALDATGAEPDAQILRVRAMFETTQRYVRRQRGAAGKRRKLTAKKSSKLKTRGRKPKVLRQRHGEGLRTR
jgi:hypothetical protein